MTVNNTRVLTYLDFVKGLDPKGNFAHRIVELVSKKVEMLDDMTVIAANNGTALETTVRTETPTPVWTTYYGGIPSNKGSKAKIKVSCGRMATKILVDKKLYDESKDKDAVLEDEISANITGMRNELANAMIYGLVRENPLGINGLFKHYSAYDDGTTDDTDSAHYVLNGSDVGSNTDFSNLGSIALVGWSPNTITAFHPENSTTGGIEKSDKRVTDITDPDMGGDATYEAYLQYIYWTLGLAVRDYRYGGRICNLPRNKMLTKGHDGDYHEGDYVELIDRLSQRVLDDDVKQAFYMDKTMWEIICVLYSRLTRANAITFQHIEGRKEKKLYGIPVRIMDPMKVNEAKVNKFEA